MLSRPLTVLPQPKRFSTCLNVTNKHTGESFSSDSALAPLAQTANVRVYGD